MQKIYLMRFQRMGKGGFHAKNLLFAPPRRVRQGGFRAKNILIAPSGRWAKVVFVQKIYLMRFQRVGKGLSRKSPLHPRAPVFPGLLISPPNSLSILALFLPSQKPTMNSGLTRLVGGGFGMPCNFVASASSRRLLGINDII